MMKTVNSSMIHLTIYCKNIYKCHNVSPPSTTIKKRKKKCLNAGANGGSPLLNVCILMSEECHLSC
jgi:hypothetical protein